MKNTSKSMPEQTLSGLFSAMAAKNKSKAEAEKAFNIFYQRYKDYLYTVTKKACKAWKKHGQDLIVSIFDNTMLKIYNCAEKFIRIRDIAAEEQDIAVKALLGRIASKEMCKILKEYRDDNIDYTEDMLVFENIREECTEQKTKLYLLAEEALDSLTERERDILRTYMMFKEGERKLPKEELKKLAEYWGVQASNLRKIKQRAVQKVKDYIINSKNNGVWQKNLTQKKTNGKRSS